MNKLKSLILLIIVIAFTSCSVSKTNQTLDQNLNQLLEQKDYFRLSEQLQINKEKISKDRFLYYKAFVDNAFGENTQSIAQVEVLLETYKTNFNDSIAEKILALKADNYIHTHQYKQASVIYGDILNQFSKDLDSADIADYKNMKSLFETLGTIAPQVMQEHQTVKIASYRNQFNHLMAPIKVNEIAEDFIFDTGANLSTISESQAKKMNLKLFEQNIDVGSSTGINVASKLAVADSLYFGPILFKNVVFIVMPDEKLSFPEIDYYIHGIIGFPVIHQLEEIHLNKDGSIVVPEKPTASNLKNMFLEGLTPVIKTTSGKDTLLFTFDTGASQSELSYFYYKEHKAFHKVRSVFGVFFS